MNSVERTAHPGEPASPGGGVLRLVFAESVSVAGDWILITAASIAVFRHTDSTVAVSILLALVALPTVLLGPIAGALADRYDRRRLIVLADAMSALVLFVCMGLAAVGVTLPTVYGAVIVVNILATFHRPASEALMPSLSGTENLGRANSMLRMGTRLAMIGGPAIASVLMGAGGLRLVFAVDAFSFVSSAALVAGIANRAGVGTGSYAGSAWRSAMAGFEYARHNTKIRTVIGAIGATMLVAQVVNAGTLALVSDVLDLPASRYGVLLAAEGGGALGLALLFTYLGPRLPLIPTGAMALLITGLSIIGLGLAPGFVVAMVSMAVMGVGVVGLQVAFTSYLQRETPDSLRGRTMSLVSIVASLAALLGLTLAGPLVYLLGVRIAFVSAGLVICGSGLPVLALLRLPVAASEPASSDTASA